MTTSIKKIKDMTSEEKQERIVHLSHKFYDINERPSLLLRSEMERIDPDQRMLDMLKNLEILEERCHKLQDSYTTSVGPGLRKLKRIFEYEQNLIVNKYNEEKLVQPFTKPCTHTPAQIEEIYKNKLSKLKKEQEIRKNNLEANIMGNIEACEEKIRLMFMSTIRYIYR